MKLFTILKQVLALPVLTKGHPLLLASFKSIDGSAERAAQAHNAEEINLANFEVQKEALQKTLYLTYASFMMSTLASLVAVAALIVAIVK